MTNHEQPDLPSKGLPVEDPKPSTKNSAPKPTTIDLKYTVRLGAMEVTQLVFPVRLLGKHLRRWSYNAEGLVDNDVYLKIAADSTGLPDKVFDEMDSEDVGRVVQVVQAFLLQSGFLRVLAGS